jgi:alkylation response protein AidB-like acyl-CoA dehydrogenase
MANTTTAVPEIESDADAAQLRRVVTDALSTLSDLQRVRKVVESGEGYDRSLWQRWGAELDLHGIGIPECYGGSGASFKMVAVVLEALAAHLTPGPYLASGVLAAHALQAAGDTEAMQRYLPGIATGQRIATVALSERQGGWTEAAVRASATRTRDGWAISGVKRFVPYAAAAATLLVFARVGGEIALFAVDVDEAGPTVEVRDEPTMDLTRRLGLVRLNGAPASLVSAPGEGWAVAESTLRVACAAIAAESVGIATSLLDETVRFARTRYQFGVPIGSFQVIQHRLADLLVRAESIKSVAFDCADALATDRVDVVAATHLAKAFCADAAFEVAADAIQLHGGIGFTWEHPAHLYFKRAKSNQLIFGASRHHKDQLGRSLGI